jgi:hypothetical protein
MKLRTVALSMALLAQGFHFANADDRVAPTREEKHTMNQNKYVGMWVTADGYVRHELLPGGRYDEAPGKS